MTTRTTRRGLLAVSTFAVAIPILAGCQAFGVNEQYGAEYADLGDMEASWDAARVPQLVPDDAKDIRIAYNTIDEGAMLAFTAEGGITADYCEPGAVEGEPAFEPGWWPEGELPGEGFTCGDWIVVQADDRFVVWD
ncbi:hypothetical protein [Diaminobutyricimonas aerilata]|nr:hypothetical protein [Diaminobutyricimonas aerilata]